MSLLKNKIIKNFSVLTGTNLLVQVFSIFSSIRLARQLQPEGYGIFNLISLQASIFSIIACYGLRLVMIRHIARNNDDARKVFVLSSNIRLLTTTIAIVLVFLYNLAYGHDSLSIPLVIAVMALIVFQTFWDGIESVFFGFEKMEASGIMNLVFTLIWIAEIYLIPDAQFNVLIVTYAYILNQGVKSIVYYFWMRQSILKNQASPKFTNYREHVDLVKQSNFFFVLVIFSSIQNQMPILLLQFNSTIDQIGLFNLGNRILSPLQMMLNLLLAALFPMLSRLAIDNKLLFAQRVKSLMNIIILSGILGSVLFALFSNDIVRLLYGDAYKTSANVILIQCWFTVLFAMFCTIGTVLSALDKQKLMSRLSIIYASTAFPIFFIGTKYGATGLAWAFVIAAFVNMTYHWVIFRNLLEKSISVFYSIFIFTTIAILCVYSGLYEISLPFSIRLLLGLVLSVIFLAYIYKIEYKNILSNNLAKYKTID